MCQVILQKHCDRMKAEVRKRFKPSLFQHVGTQSSLRGKTQKLKVYILSLLCLVLSRKILGHGN